MHTFVRHSGATPFMSGRRSPFALLSALVRLQRSRVALARLDTERLADIGLTASEAEREARQPFWR